MQLLLVAGAIAILWWFFSQQKKNKKEEIFRNQIFMLLKAIRKDVKRAVFLAERIQGIQKIERKALVTQTSQDEDSSKENLDSPATVVEKFPLQPLPKPICIPSRSPTTPSANTLHYYGTDPVRIKDLVVPNAQRILTSPVDSDQNRFLSTPERTASDGQQETRRIIKKAQYIDGGWDEEETSRSSSSRERTDYSSQEDTDTSFRSRSHTRSGEDGKHDESLSDEEDNFAEKDLQKLERVVLKINGLNSNSVIDESTSRSLLERINSRQLESSLKQEHLNNKHFDQTVANVLTKNKPDSKFGSGIRLSRGSSVDLGRLREEARRRARMKSDEQLGIVSTPVGLFKNRSPPLRRDRAATTGRLENELPSIVDKLDLRRRAFSTSCTDSAFKNDFNPPPSLTGKLPKQPFYGYLSPNLQPQGNGIRGSCEKIKEPIYSENWKENELRSWNSIWDHLRGQRNQSPIAPMETLRGVSIPSTTRISISLDHIPCAVVAPSPRPPASIVSKTMGIDDPQNADPPLEWGSLVREKQILADCERDLQLKGKKVRLEHRFRDLDALIEKLKNLKIDDDDDDDERATLLRGMLGIIDQQKELKPELNEKNVTMRRRKGNQKSSLAPVIIDYRDCNPETSAEPREESKDKDSEVANKNK